MGIIIYHSKSTLPYIKLKEATLVVNSNKEVHLISTSGDIRIPIVIDGKYLNIDKAYANLNSEDFSSLLEILSKNCLLPSYLVEHKLVVEEHSIFYPEAPDSRLCKHEVGVDSAKDKGGRSINWSNLVIHGARPNKVKCVHKPGTVFELENCVWVFVRNMDSFGIAELLCLKGSKQGKIEEYWTDFVNELIPAEVVIEVV